MAVTLGAGSFGSLKRLLSADRGATFQTLIAEGLVSAYPTDDGTIVCSPAAAAPLMLRLLPYTTGAGNPGGSIEVWAWDTIEIVPAAVYSVMTPLAAYAFSTTGTPPTRLIGSGITAKFPDTVAAPTVGNANVDTVNTAAGSGGPAGAAQIVVNIRGSRVFFVRLKTDGVATAVNCLVGVAG